jgi:hypothetical protein
VTDRSGGWRCRAADNDEVSRSRGGCLLLPVLAAAVPVVETRCNAPADHGSSARSFADVRGENHVAAAVADHPVGRVPRVRMSLTRDGVPAGLDEPEPEPGTQPPVRA